MEECVVVLTSGKFVVDVVGNPTRQSNNLQATLAFQFTLGQYTFTSRNKITNYNVN